jgi:hypothetical protein
LENKLPEHKKPWSHRLCFREDLSYVIFSNPTDINAGLEEIPVRMKNVVCVHVEDLPTSYNLIINIPVLKTLRLLHDYRLSIDNISKQPLVFHQISWFTLLTTKTFTSLCPGFIS